MPGPTAAAVTNVITAWLEGPQWRYYVRHVQSGEERYFAHLEDVAALLGQSTGIHPLVLA
jgi:hypothetical protein